MEFDWDDANETHIAQHRVTRVEAETVLIDPLAAFIDSRIEDNELRFRQVGSTASGRLLVVAFTLRGELIRPITAFDADRPTARRYRQGQYN